jgi:hypothetical protein
MRRHAPGPPPTALSVPDRPRPACAGWRAARLRVHEALGRAGPCGSAAVHGARDPPPALSADERTRRRRPRARRSRAGRLLASRLRGAPRSAGGRLMAHHRALGAPFVPCRFECPVLADRGSRYGTASSAVCPPGAAPRRPEASASSSPVHSILCLDRPLRGSNRRRSHGIGNRARRSSPHPGRLPRGRELPDRGIHPGAERPLRMPVFPPLPPPAALRPARAQTPAWNRSRSCG